MVGEKVLFLQNILNLVKYVENFLKPFLQAPNSIVVAVNANSKEYANLNQSLPVGFVKRNSLREAINQIQNFAAGNVLLNLGG